jgi:hypothetical protein
VKAIYLLLNIPTLKRSRYFSAFIFCCSIIFPFQTSPQPKDVIDNRISSPAHNSTVLYSAIDTSNMKPQYNQQGEPLPVIDGINLREHNEPYKTETIETTLIPRQQIEYMAKMDQGEVLLYSWEVDGKSYFDFHAHQENVNPDIWIRYEEGARLKANGSIIAPYSGEHGWYWVNLDTRPVKLKLTVSGYYKEMVRIDL